MSINVSDWVTRLPVGPDAGLTVYMVTEPDIAGHSNPLASAVPDAAGSVVLEDYMSTGIPTYLVMNDSSESPDDLWSHVAMGPMELPGAVECVEAPAIQRGHGDTFLTEAGFPPGGSATLAGTVILEVVDEAGELRDLIGVGTTPSALTYYFSDDRQHVDRFLTSTTSAGAAFTVAARYCSSLCRNITCECGDPECGILPVAVGGVGNGFMFGKMPCHRQP